MEPGRAAQMGPGAVAAPALTDPERPVTPPAAVVSFAHEDESLSARFQLSMPASVKVGVYTLRAVATSPSTGATPFANGYQEIEYPHIQRRHVIKPAETTNETSGCEPKSG